MRTTRQSHNQENIQHQNTTSQRSSAHPSQQSLSKPFKPSIKVGYEIATAREQVIRRYKKPVIMFKHQIMQKLGVKKVQNNTLQIKSGAFINSQYVPGNLHKADSQCQRRKGVVEVQQKIHGSRQFRENLKKQFVKRCKSTASVVENCNITQRSKLSGYKKEGIKDILQYRHAGNYRQNKVALKCTNQNVNNRCLSYRQLHQYDFRKNRLPSK